MGLNWYHSKDILMERHLVLQTLRWEELGIHQGVLPMILLVMLLKAWREIIWAVFHLLQAGEPGEMESATVN